MFRNVIAGTMEQLYDTDRDQLMNIGISFLLSLWMYWERQVPDKWGCLISESWPLHLSFMVWAVKPLQVSIWLVLALHLCIYDTLIYASYHSPNINYPWSISSCQCICTNHKVIKNYIRNIILIIENQTFHQNIYFNLNMKTNSYSFIMKQFQSSVIQVSFSVYHDSKAGVQRRERVLHLK